MIDDWLNHLKRLSSYEFDVYIGDNLNVAASESYLRRCLEAMFDIGRHILAKTGSTDLAGEYKSIARGLQQKNIVSPGMGEKLIQMAGYRNRMVHFYSMVTDQELFSILHNDLGDIEAFILEIKTYLSLIQKPTSLIKDK